MLDIITSHKFDRDAKRMVRRGKKWSKMEVVIENLSDELPLERKYEDHKLSGALAGRRECHVEPDWLLIYIPTSRQLILERTGTHSDLYG